MRWSSLDPSCYYARNRLEHRDFIKWEYPGAQIEVAERAEEPPIRKPNGNAYVRHHRIAGRMPCEATVTQRVGGGERMLCSGYDAAIRAIEPTYLATHRKRWVLPIEEILVAKKRRIDPIYSGKSVPRSRVEHAKRIVHSERQQRRAKSAVPIFMRECAGMLERQKRDLSAGAGVCHARV